MSDEHIHSSRSWLSDGLMVASVTALIYLGTFVYEYGFCSNFGIPVSLISPNISTILTAAAALGSVLIVVFVAIATVRPFIQIFKPPERNGWRYIWLYIGVWFLALIFLKHVYAWTSATTGFALLRVTLVTGVFLLPPLLFFDKGVPFVDRIAEYVEGKHTPDEGFTESFERRVGFGHYFVVAAICFFLLIAWVIGDGEAQNKTEFMTLKDDLDTVVLRNYGELMIGAKFSRVTRQVVPELRLIWLGDKKRTDFLIERVGPLTFQDLKKEQAASSPKASASAAERR